MSATSTTSTESAFNPFTAGIEFMQQFTKNMAANNGLAGGLSAMPGMPEIPGMPAWAMPTADPVELEKRINELKTVLFWLEQNTGALKATVQALEVQKMTLETLRNMGENMSKAATPSKPSSQSGTATSAKRRKS